MRIAKKYLLFSELRRKKVGLTRVRIAKKIHSSLLDSLTVLTSRSKQSSKRGDRGIKTFQLSRNPNVRVSVQQARGSSCLFRL
jgi:hypothetical protein